VGYDIGARRAAVLQAGNHAHDDGFFLEEARRRGTARIGFT
jgi:hypothetical protein